MAWKSIGVAARPMAMTRFSTPGHLPWGMARPLPMPVVRVAAIAFIRMLDRFPRFETAAYLLVILIGLKLLVDWYFNKPPEGQPANEVFHGPVDFHSPSNPAFWVFWIGMLVCFCIGFIPPKKRGAPPVSPA